VVIEAEKANYPVGWMCRLLNVRTALMQYDAAGAFLGAELVADVQSYLDKARRALEASTRFTTFTAGGGQ
jgi:hypothetical protein